MDLKKSLAAVRSADQVPSISFRAVIERYPDAAGEITDCLSGDVNKDFSRLWNRIREFVPLPDDLPYGEPLERLSPAAEPA